MHGRLTVLRFTHVPVRKMWSGFIGRVVHEQQRLRVGARLPGRPMPDDERSVRDGWRIVHGRRKPLLRIAVVYVGDGEP